MADDALTGRLGCLVRYSPRPLFAEGVAQTWVGVRCSGDDFGMAQKFLSCDREQELLLPPSLRDWLPEEHLAWFVLEAERAAQAKPVPRSRPARLTECQRRLRQDWELERRVVADHAEWLAAGIASDGSRRMSGARHNGSVR